jgi:hypothetical protein
MCLRRALESRNGWHPSRVAANADSLPGVCSGVSVSEWGPAGVRMALVEGIEEHVDGVRRTLPESSSSSSLSVTAVIYLASLWLNLIQFFPVKYR